MPRTSVSLSYCCSTIRCLSKLHDSALRIWSISSLLSKVKRITWSPSFFILKPFFDLQSGVNVLAIASIFSALFVKNLVARTKSVTASSSLIWRLEPSTFESVRQLHDFVNSSIPQKTHRTNRNRRKKREKKEKKNFVSLTPKEKENHKALR